MNDLPLHVHSSLDMYADDSTLGVSGKTIEDLEVKLNPDMAKVNKCCKDNIMAINCDTTKVMLVTTYQKGTKLDSTHLSVIYDNTELENVNSNKTAWCYHRISLYILSQTFNINSSHFKTSIDINTHL